MIKEFKIKTNQPIQIVDITSQVESVVKESGIKDGLVTVMTKHTTTAININEREEGLQHDMVRFLTELVPENRDYIHDRIHDRKSADGRGNAHSHLLSLLSSASAILPLADGELQLGTWQSVFFVEYDGPRESRTVVVQIIKCI